jgi:hypothetical protein
VLILKGLLTAWDCSSNGRANIVKPLMCIYVILWLKLLHQLKHQRAFLELLPFCETWNIKMTSMLTGIQSKTRPVVQTVAIIVILQHRMVYWFGIPC